MKSVSKWLRKCDPVLLLTGLASWIFDMDDKWRKMTSNVIERAGIIAMFVLVYLWRGAFWWLVAPIGAILLWRDVFWPILSGFGLCTKCGRLKLSRKGIQAEDAFMCHRCRERYETILAEARRIEEQTDALFGKVTSWRGIEASSRPKAVRIFRPPEDALKKIEPPKLSFIEIQRK